MLGSGRLFHVDELSALTRGHDPYLTSPLGWRPAPVDGQAIANLSARIAAVDGDASRHRRRERARQRW